MRGFSLWLTILAGLTGTAVTAADGDPKRGAQVYRACLACHALEPGLHLSGPSLGNVIGRAAGNSALVQNFGRSILERGTNSHVILENNPLERRYRCINAVAQQAHRQPNDTKHAGMVFLSVKYKGGKPCRANK